MTPPSRKHRPANAIAPFRTWLLVSCTLGTLASSGCGLVDDDLLEFDFETDDREFEINTDQWMLPAIEKFPELPCTTANDTCAAASETFCTLQEGGCDPENWNAACSSPSNTCSVTLRAALSREIDLSEEQEFSKVNDQPLASVSIKGINYQVLENTLNVDSPELVIFVGPLGTMSASDANAKRVGAVSPIAAFQKPAESIELSPEGKAHLKEFMEGEEYKSPFSVIVAAEFVVAVGDLVPSGKARVVVSITASARLGL